METGEGDMRAPSPPRRPPSPGGEEGGAEGAPPRGGPHIYHTLSGRGTPAIASETDREKRREMLARLQAIMELGGDEREQLRLMRDEVSELVLGPLANEFLSLISGATDPVDPQTMGVAEMARVAVRVLASEERMMTESMRRADRVMEGSARQTKDWVRGRVGRQEEALEDVKVELARRARSEEDTRAQIEDLTRQMAALQEQNCYWREEAARAARAGRPGRRAKGPRTFVDPPTEFGRQPLVGEIDKMKQARFTFPDNGSFSGQADSRMTVERYLSHLTKAQNSLKLTKADFEDKLCAGASGPAQTTIENALRRGLSLEAIYTTLLEKYSKTDTPEQAEAKLAVYVPTGGETIGVIVDEVGQLAGQASAHFVAKEAADAFEESLMRKTILRILPPSAATSLKLKLLEADQYGKLSRDQLISEILSLRDFLNDEMAKQKPKKTVASKVVCQGGGKQPGAVECVEGVPLEEVMRKQDEMRLSALAQRPAEPSPAKPAREAEAKTDVGKIVSEVLQLANRNPPKPPMPPPPPPAPYYLPPPIMMGGAPPLPVGPPPMFGPPAAGGQAVLSAAATPPPLP